MPNLVFPVVALLVVAACGGSSSSASPAPAAAPKVLTRAHDGKTFTLRRGREVSLRLSGMPWQDPKTSSRAVGITRVEYFQDPGFLEWIVEGVRPGRAVVTSTAGERRFRVTLVVPSGSG